MKYAELLESIREEKKTPKDWAKDHPDDLESREKPNGDGKSVEVLTCRD